MKRLAGRIAALALAGMAGIAPIAASAQDSVEAVGIADSGATGWLLAATAFALIAALPGLALFYAGQLRSRNALSLCLQVGAVGSLVSILWVILGYSLAFSATGGDWIGSAQNFMFGNMVAIREDQAVGELVWGLFQMSVAMFAPALLAGAWAERARFGWAVAFAVVWTLLVYIPVTRWTAGGGWLEDLGAIDFAGGLSVHLAAGVSALVVALMIGRRSAAIEGLGRPGNSLIMLAGAGLLWAGIMARNGGFAASASDIGAGTAMIVTHLSAATAALTWLALDRWRTGKASASGFALGVFTGLAAIAPAAGSVGPAGGILTGLIAVPLARAVLVLVRDRLRIDDALGVFATQGIGAATGALLLAFFSSVALGGIGYSESAGIGSQLLYQALAVGAVTLWSAFATLIAGYAVAMILPMRVTAEAEVAGLDVAAHGES